MSTEAQYLGCSIVWSVAWLLVGVLGTLAAQEILNHWRHRDHT